MRRIWVFAALAAILIVNFGASPHEGFNSTCVNDQCYMSASSSLVSLIASAILAVFTVFYPQKAGESERTEPVKIKERFAAFLIDFFIVISAGGPVATLPILLTEAKAVGRFQWSFERDFSRPTDYVLAVPGVFFMFGLLFVYFYVHLLIGRQTVGQYLLGYRVEGAPSVEGKKPAWGLSVLLGYVGLCVWPISVYLAAKREDKAFWWNLQTDTRLVRTA
ncbi:MAG: RDD family protein [Alphaproteobacteria bacterium]